MEFGDFDIFAAKDEVALQGRVLSLNPDQVYPDPENVRRMIDDAEIQALAATIKDRGQLQPITVAAADEDGRYRIHFGERRWRACRQLGIPVRAVVSEQRDSTQIRIDQFVENDQRAQLSSSDMIAFVVGQVKGGRSISDLARATGRDRAQLARYHSLGSAPDFLVARVDDIPLRSAMALLRATATNEAATLAFVTSAPEGGLTVNACERFSQTLGDEGDAEPGADKTSETARQARRYTDSNGKTSPSAKPSLLPDRSEPTAPLVHSEQYIDIDGRRARIVMAVVRFDGEADTRAVHFTS